jgi:hypothetical protein
LVCVSWHLSPSQRLASYISPISLCVCMRIPPTFARHQVGKNPLIVARQRLGKNVPGATNTRNNRRVVGRICLWVCLCVFLSLLGNNSVKTFPQQGKIVGGVVF